MLTANTDSAVGPRASMFTNARELTIDGGSFYIIHRDAHVTHITNVATPVKSALSGMELLQNHVTTAAFHDAPCGPRYDPPKCLPQTRDAVQNVIMDWVKNLNNPALFLWLHGPAGSGKSSIAHTIAKNCKEGGFLGGTFFFSGQVLELEDDKTNIVATIAYQLAQHIPCLDEFIRQAICKDPLIFTKSLDVQLKSLVIDPMTTAAASPALSGEFNKPIVVIIDALDEIKDPAGQRYILNTLHDALYSSGFTHKPFAPGLLRFLITSRPEQHIRNTFSLGSLSNNTFALPLDDRYLPTKDVRLFLESEFQKIRACHARRCEFPKDWPTKQHLEELVHRSSGQFIYAVTVMKYIQSPSDDPVHRLNNIIDKRTESDAPFAMLDTVYHDIFSSVKDPPQVLEILFFSMQDWAVPPEESWHNVFGYSWGDILVALLDLHALLKVPEDPGSQIQFYHGSLVDFLCDKNRSKRYYLYSPDMRTRYVKQWIKYLKSRSYASERISKNYDHSPPIPELTDALACYTSPETEYIKSANHGLHWKFIQDHIDSKPLPERIIKAGGLPFCRKDYVITTWFVTHLTRYPGRVQSHLIVATTFPELFSRCSMQLYYAVFSLNLSRAESRKIVSLLSAFQHFIRDLEIKDWTRLLSSAYDFLTETSESGRKNTNMEMYTAFAHDLARCLSLGRGTESALFFLPELLPVAAENKELEDLLYAFCFGQMPGSPVLPDQSSMHDLKRATSEYILRYRTTSPTQSRRASTATFSTLTRQGSTATSSTQSRMGSTVTLSSDPKI